MPEASVRDVLEQVPLPVESPTFFDEFWMRAEREQRRAARRRRWLAAGVSVIAIAAATAAGVFAFGGSGTSGLDETYACTAFEQNSVSLIIFDLFTSPKIGAVAVWSAHLPILRNSFPQRGQINVDSRACRKVSRSVPFSRLGLPLTANMRADADNNVEATFTCNPKRILIRLRITFDSTGNAALATVVVANASTGKRIALVREEPPHLVTYVGAGCRHR
jgi:hypothetical protein